MSNPFEDPKFVRIVVVTLWVLVLIMAIGVSLNEADFKARIRALEMRP